MGRGSNILCGPKLKEFLKEFFEESYYYIQSLRRIMRNVLYGQRSVEVLRPIQQYYDYRVCTVQICESCKGKHWLFVAVSNHSVTLNHIII